MYIKILIDYIRDFKYPDHIQELQKVYNIIAPLPKSLPNEFIDFQKIIEHNNISSTDFKSAKDFLVKFVEESK